MKVINKYIISCVIPNAAINKGFLKTLELIAKKEKAEILIYGTKLTKKESYMEQELFEEYFFNSDFQINKNYKVYNYAIRHLTANPISGLTYFEKTAIIPAPRLLMESLPRQIKKTTVPRAIWTTGTICEADSRSYNNDKNQQKSRTMHRETGIGAIIIEELENGLCNIRHLEYKNGKIYDFREKKEVICYNIKEYKKAKAESITAGDRHLGHTDLTVSREVDRIIEKASPSYIYEHDLVDGTSKFVNHHSFFKQITMQKNDMTPKKELELLLNFLEKRKKKFHKSKTIIVPSNHNDFYDRFLEDKTRTDKFLDQIKEEFYKNPVKSELKEILENVEIVKELYEYKYNNKEVLEEYCKKRINLSKTIFLKKGDNSIVKNWECGNHGDAGVNGSRGGWQKLAYNSNVFGHTHSTKRTPYAVWTGVLERLDADYCDPNGFSTWTYAVVLIYPNGALQQILIFNNDLEKFK